MVTADARPWRAHQQFRRILSPTHRRNCEPPQQHRPRVNNSPNSNNKSPTTTTAQHFGSSPVAGHHGHYLFLQRFQEIFYRDRQDPGGIFDTVLFRFFQPASCVWGGFSPGYFATRLIALLARGLCPRSTGSHTQLICQIERRF